jgi:hypothetical protein
VDALWKSLKKGRFNETTVSRYLYRTMQQRDRAGGVIESAR